MNISELMDALTEFSHRWSLGKIMVGSDDGDFSLFGLREEFGKIVKVAEFKIDR